MFVRHSYTTAILSMYLPDVRTYIYECNTDNRQYTPDACFTAIHWCRKFLVDERTSFVHDDDTIWQLVSHIRGTRLKESRESSTDVQRATCQSCTMAFYCCAISSASLNPVHNPLKSHLWCEPTKCYKCNLYFCLLNGHFLAESTRVMCSTANVILAMFDSRCRFYGYAGKETR